MEFIDRTDRLKDASLYLQREIRIYVSVGFKVQERLLKRDFPAEVW